MEITQTPVTQDEKIAQIFAQGGSLRLLAGMDTGKLMLLEQYAAQLFENKDLIASRNVYFLLSNFDQWNGNYLTGLGLCHQRLGSHEAALFCFSRAGAIDITNPKPAFFAATSYMHISEKACARKALIATLRWCGEHDEHQEIKCCASRMLDSLEDD